MHVSKYIDQMKDVFNHSEFMTLTENTFDKNPSITSYYMQLGQYLAAKVLFPELSSEEGMIKIAMMDVTINPPQQADHVPGVLDMAKSVAGEFKDWIQAGFARRSSTEIDAILDTCRACEFHQDLPGGFLRCDQRKGGCGCVADIKAWMATTACPKGKW